MLDLKTARETASRHGWLSLTPPAFQRVVLERTKLRRLKAKEALHYTGDDSIGMYGLAGGCLKVMVSAGEHGPYLVHMMWPGAWLGEGPSITGRPRVVTMTATADCDLLFLPRSSIHEIVQADPAFWPLFVIPLQDHFEVALVAVADAMLPSHLKRLAAALLRLGGLRGGFTVDVSGHIDLDISQEELAVMTNVTRPTAGSGLRKLAEKGLVDVGYARLTLVDVAGLQALLAE